MQRAARPVRSAPVPGRSNAERLAASGFSSVCRISCLLRLGTAALRQTQPQTRPERKHFARIRLLPGGREGLLWVVALVRILVDGYSLLHSWPELAPEWPRHSAAARDALVKRLTLYQDASGTPITIFFDGAAGRGGRPASDPISKVEVLFSRGNQTADQMIERAAHRLGGKLRKFHSRGRRRPGGNGGRSQSPQSQGTPPLRAPEMKEQSA